MTPNTCPRIDEAHAFADDQLADDARAAFLSHLSDCTECRETIKDTSVLGALTRFAYRPEARAAAQGEPIWATYVTSKLRHRIPRGALTTDAPAHCGARPPRELAIDGWESAGTLHKRACPGCEADEVTSIQGVTK